MKAKIFLSLILIPAFSLSLLAGPQDDFDKANKAYSAGFYENAISLYEKIIADGSASPDIFYNLGNAYFKLDDIPSAILNYERALKWDPSNEDYQYNLKVANNKIVDKIDVLPELFYVRWWKSLKLWFSPDGWAKTALFTFALIFITVALFLLTSRMWMRKALFSFGILLILVNLISGIIAMQTYKEAKNQRTAIIFTPTVPVKSSPDESSIDLFVIHEGLKVTVIDEIGDWNEIRIANGSKGWIQSEHFKAI